MSYFLHKVEYVGTEKTTTWELPDMSAEDIAKTVAEIQSGIFPNTIIHTTISDEVIDNDIYFWEDDMRAKDET